MIPKTSLKFKPSRSAIIIVIAAILLASLLAILTVGNIKREENLMQNFLLHEGMTLIRSFEAGARTTMMHQMRGDEPLITLVAETVKEVSVVYIKIVGRDGRVIAAAGDFPKDGNGPDPTRILAASEAITTLRPQIHAFEVAAAFKPLTAVANRNMKMMMGGWQRGDAAASRNHKVIYLGLATNEFDRARDIDIRHAVLLGAIVFLTGIAGFYILFVSQAMRVAKSTLADMELYTRNVIECMPAGLITLDTEGRVVSCNSKAEDITGKLFSELVGGKLAAQMPSCPDLSSEMEMLVEEPLLCPHGDESIPVRVSSSRLMGTDGTLTGLVLVIRDMREMHEMEQKLERSRRLASLGRMAAGIAHEIRNPLGTIRGFAQLFKKAFSEKPTERGYAELMIDEVDRLNRTISGLLQFAKPRVPELKKFCLADLLVRAAQLLEDDCRAKEIKVTVKEAADIYLNGDPDLMLQVLINLLKNSIEASERGGEIIIAADSGESGVVIRVEDNGRGMGREQRGRMFDPFYTTRREGTGLGLAIVHQIINQHNGTIEVLSTEGQGTIISLTLPPSTGEALAI